jgi:hypothetical protein
VLLTSYQPVAQEVTSSSIMLTWGIPERDNGLPIQEYVVYMKSWRGAGNSSDSSSASGLREICRGKERVHVAVGLSANTVYIFQVNAVNRVGEGPPSEKLAMRTLPEVH